MPGEKEKAIKDKFKKELTAFGQALKSFHKGDYQKASELLKVFLKKENTERELADRAEMYLKICQTRMETKKVTLKTFDDYFTSGVYKANQGEYEEAVDLLNKAHDLKPKEGKVFYLLASVFKKMEKIEESLELLKKAIQEDKNFAVLAQNETDFESFKEDEKFKQITRME